MAIKKNIGELMNSLNEHPIQDQSGKPPQPPYSPVAQGYWRGAEMIGGTNRSPRPIAPIRQSPPPPQQQPQIPQTKQVKSQSLESMIGKNILGIIAACLIFLGLLLLGFLVVPTMTDMFKTVLMFLFSSVLTAIGTFLTLRNKNSFTVALLGCGCGSFFITIMLAHAFFQVIPSVAAYGLLVAWLAGSLALVKLTDSYPMNILVHTGMIFSLCFAYASKTSEEQIILLLVYHALSVALIIFGNKLYFTKTYRFGLLCSLFLSFIAVCFMFDYYLTALQPITFTQTLSAIGAFTAQTIGASLLSFALYRSTREKKSHASRTALHVVNKTLLLLIFFVVLYLSSGLLIESAPFVSRDLIASFPYASLYVATLVTVVAALLHVFVDAFLQSRRAAKNLEDNKLETISIFMMSIYAALILLVNYYANVLTASNIFYFPGSIVVALALIACSHKTGLKAYSALALGMLGADFLLMLSGGYAVLVEHGTVVLPLLYLAVYCAILIFEWKTLDKERQDKLLSVCKVTLLVVCELSIISIFTAAAMEIATILLVLSVVFIIQAAFRVDIRGRASSAYWVFIRIHEFVLVLLNSWIITNQAWFDSSIALIALLAVANLAILTFSLLRIKAETRLNVSWLSVVVGICLTLSMMASVSGLTPWSNGPFSLSIIIMITALLCIIAGLFMQIKPLRIYGLILVIICVVKLVTLDIGDAEATTRVVALIVGGIICFGISALYNYSVKRFEERPEMQ